MSNLPERPEIHQYSILQELEKQLYNADILLNGGYKDEFLYPNMPLIPSDAINSLPPFNEAKLNWCRIKTLGTVAEEKKGDEKEKLYTKFTEILAGKEKAFSILLSGSKYSSDVSYKIGTAGDIRQIDSALCGVFGYSDTEESTGDCDKKYIRQAKCIPVKEDFESLDKAEQDKELSKLIDNITMVVTCSDCSARLSFMPANIGWIQNELDKAYVMKDKITYYIKRQAQLSIGDSDSNSCNYKDRKPIEIINKKEAKLVAKDFSSAISFGESNTISFTANIVDQLAESIERSLEYRIRLLEQMKNGGWFVRMTVESNTKNDGDIEVVCDAMAAEMLRMGYSCTWSDKKENTASVVLPSHLLPNIISMPTKSFIGFELKKCTEYNLNPPVCKDEDKIVLGTLLWNGIDTGVEISVSKKELNRHMFVCGMTGSGKTNSVCRILEGIEDINYTVIEPVKGEYHSLKGIKRRTMISGDRTAIRFNPFWFPKGSNLQYHVDSLKLIISSAFELTAAMPNILEQCLNFVYMDCGWDLSSSKNIYDGKLPDSELYPTFESLCNRIREYIDNSDFAGELKSNYRGALLSRLQSFTSGAKGDLLNTTEYISFEEWNSNNFVIELDALADDSDKAIVMGALLVQYFQFIKYRYEHKAEDGLKHIFVLEEAHHLFAESQPVQGEGQNSTGHLVKMLNNLLAEIRAYGEGFIIIDQSPSAISKSVLKNTGVKLVHKVDFGEDIQLLESVLLLEKDDRTVPALAKGDALVRFATMPAPSMVHMALCNNKEKCTIQKGICGGDIQMEQYERIMSNKLLAEELELQVTRLLNVMLYQNMDQINCAYRQFKTNVRRIIISRMGVDSEECITDKFYIRLIKTLSVVIAEKIFPGNFCLCRMIKMYILRLVGFLMSDTEISVGSKEWTLLYLYREVQLYSRMSAFYSNSTDYEVQKIVNLKKYYLYECSIIITLVKELWDVHAEERYKKCGTYIDMLFGIKIDDTFKERITKEVICCINNS
ncbi:MAG: ATP-binding protein [Clostridia bacterium]|nr:ATP-binding protein [Clostridia bacterium]